MPYSRGQYAMAWRVSARQSHVFLFLLFALMILSWGATPTVAQAGSQESKNSSKHPAKLRLEPDLSIGIEEGDSTQMFGKILDIAIDDDGNIYVVDLGFMNVRVYSPEGEYQRSIGRTGQGPGEYDRPLTIDVDSDGTVLVADLNRLHLFDPEGVPIDSFPHGSGGRAVRSVAFGTERTLLATWFEVWDQKIIHRYSRDGEQIGAFCDSYAVGSDVDTREELTVAGGVLVTDKSDRILYAQSYPFKLVIFGSDGEEERSIVGGMRALDEEVEFTLEDDGYSVFLPTYSRGAIFLPDGRIFHTNLKRSHEDYNSVQSIFELFDAEGEFIASSVVPNLLIVSCADSAGRLFSFVEEPYPQLQRSVLVVEDVQ